MTEKTKSEISEKFAQDGYPVHVIGRNVEVTDAMKTYALDKLAKIERFGANILEATIVMDIQKVTHLVDYILIVNNLLIKVSGRSENMYTSIDQAVDHLQRKIRRYKRRLREHRQKHLSEIDINVNLIRGPITLLDDVNDQIEEENLNEIEEKLRPHEVVSREKRPLKTLTQNDAIMKMELSGDQFMVYRSEEDHKLKIIYRHDDENYGIIEPE